MMAEQVLEQNQWEAGPDEELKIPEALIRQLKYEIVVFTQKKEFSFRCSSYEFKAISVCRFSNVIIDTSKLNAKGDVELKRITYHQEIVLANVPFMVVPAPEEVAAD
jgi:hypothetical protein